MYNGEREITTPISLTAPEGGLNPNAVGWSRHPLHDTSGIGSGTGGIRDVWGRNKRWEYWLVMTPTHLMSLTISDVDYASSHTVWVYEIPTGRRLDVAAIVPFARGAVLPPSLKDGTRARGGSMSLGGRVREPGPGRMRAFIDPVEDGTRLRAEGQIARRSGNSPAAIEKVRFDVVAHRSPDHESLGVVVPWSQKRFQYTVKETALPASGWVEIDDERVELPAGESWAILDHGRGRWPYKMEWNWGAASGWVNKAAVGLQFGGKWTDGTGSRENAVTIDGRLYPIHEDITWDYEFGNWDGRWHLHSPSVDVWLEPLWDHDAVTDLGVLAMKAHQVFGYFTGTVIVDGRELAIDRMLGFAEDVRNRW